MINLEWYRTFKAIYQQGTLTKAAQELMISQPNVSIQLSALESYIGQQLFIRLPRNMAPTEYGKKLYTQIVESIDNLERVEKEFKKSNLKKSQPIRIGLPSEICQVVLAPNINKINSQLIVEYGLAVDLIEKLANSQIDIAFITQKDDRFSQITFELLFTERFAIMCGAAFDTSELDTLVKENNTPQIEKWLRKQKWFAYDSNLPLIRRFWLTNFKKRPLIDLKAVIPDNVAILTAVTNSNGLVVSSNAIAYNALKKNDVKILWEGFTPTTNDLFLAYDKTKISHDVIQTIRSLIKDYLLLE